MRCAGALATAGGNVAGSDGSARAHHRTDHPKGTPMGSPNDSAPRYTTVSGVSGVSGGPDATLIERIAQLEKLTDAAAAAIEYQKRRIAHLINVLESRIGYTDLDYDTVPQPTFKGTDTVGFR